MAFEPKPTIRAVVQAKDPDATKALLNLAQDALDLLANASRNDPALASLAAPIGQIKPLAQGDRITVEADLETTTELVAVPIRQARETARRSLCATNLKQIALAMHNIPRRPWHLPARIQQGPGWQAAPELARSHPAVSRTEGALRRVPQGRALG